MTLVRLLASRVRRVLALPRTLRHRALHQAGACSVCGRASRFLAHSTNLKESLHCVRCGAWMRVRLLADVLLELFARGQARSLAELVRAPGFRALALYEAQASGPLHVFLRQCPGYRCSEYLPGVAPGATRGGVRCEDLQALTFADGSLDLVLHASVLEHVPRPQRALEESFRVLAPGGTLVFEVPMTDRGVPGLRATSRVRVDASSGQDVHLLEPSYHDDPLRPDGALVYTDFGLDLVPRLAAIGFEARLEVRPLAHSSMSHAVIVIARKPLPDTHRGPSAGETRPAPR